VATFEITEDHLRLLRAAYVGWDDCEFGAPSIDPKRPYGNSYVLGDIAEIVDPDEYARRGEISDEAVEDYMEEREDTFRRLHAETQTVLQIALSTGQFKAGTYSTHGRGWTFVSQVPVREAKPDYMTEFDNFWRARVTDESGALDVDKVARELFDYNVVMTEASSAYEELAGLSKPNSAAVHVIRMAQERFAEQYADYLCDAVADEDDEDLTRDMVITVAENWSPGAWDRFQDARRSAEAHQRTGGSF
jgi:hypothetical protein